MGKGDTIRPRIKQLRKEPGSKRQSGDGRHLGSDSIREDKVAQTDKADKLRDRRAYREQVAVNSSLDDYRELVGLHTSPTICRATEFSGESFKIFFDPENNLSPVLSFVLCGPLGFLLGVLIGINRRED